MKYKASFIRLGLGLLFIPLFRLFNLPVDGYVIFVILWFLSDFVFGAIFIQRNFYLNSLNELNYSILDKKISLTFDDGIHPINTPKVLDILKQFDIKATFFLIGKNIVGHQDILNRILEEGHQIGNHSYEHGFWFSLKSSKKMQEEIQQTNELVKQYTGVELEFFRPPYGVTNPMVAKAVENTNMRSIGWSLRSKDTVTKNKVELLTRLKSRVKRNDIILLHDRCDVTVEVLTEFIEYCQNRGFTFVTLPL